VRTARFGYSKRGLRGKIVYSRKQHADTGRRKGSKHRNQEKGVETTKKDIRQGAFSTPLRLLRGGGP